jgi:hypothetical protein
MFEESGGLGLPGKLVVQDDAGAAFVDQNEDMLDAAALGQTHRVSAKMGNSGAGPSPHYRSSGPPTVADHHDVRLSTSRIS